MTPLWQLLPFTSGPALVRNALVVVGVLCAVSAVAQERESEQYIIGEPRGIEMVVHIMGEVKRPGEYRVRDDTNVLELLSKAGGPTQFSSLGSVTIRRFSAAHATERQGRGTIDPVASALLKVNVDKCLSNKGAATPPVLHPGDVVMVPRNSWHVWKDISSVIRDVSVIASLYFLYVRTTRD